jgi:hypothetical protein
MQNRHPADRLADVAKVEAMVDVLKTALPELVTIAFTRFKAELPRIVPGLSDDEWTKLKHDEDGRRHALELLAASRDGCTEAPMIYSRDIEGFVEGTDRGPSP